MDAEVLLAHVLHLDRAQLLARLSDVLPQLTQEAFWHGIQRRAQREPLAYITGIREFWSLEFHVTPQVLIPRPETELVLETALRLLSRSAPQTTSPTNSQKRILDVGTGSGCLAIALAKELPDAELWAIDNSPAALTIAQDNAWRHNVATRIHFLQGDLFTPLVEESASFDLIVSNPPYIAETDLLTLQPEVRNWEPREALIGGRDGLEFYRRLIDKGPSHLRPRGWLVMELGAGQSSEVLGLLHAQRNFQEIISVQDYAGHDRVAVAYKAELHIS